MYQYITASVSVTTCISTIQYPSVQHSNV